jgi:hypothetical protein
MAPRTDPVILKKLSLFKFFSLISDFVFCSGQLFAKDELKKLLKEIDQDEEFWVKQRPKFESIFKEVRFFSR